MTISLRLFEIMCWCLSTKKSLVYKHSTRILPTPDDTHGYLTKILVSFSRGFIFMHDWRFDGLQANQNAHLSDLHWHAALLEARL